MKMFFSPDTTKIKWCKTENGVFREGAAEYGSDYRVLLKEATKNGEIPDLFGYMLFHGGEEIRETVSEVTRETVIKLEKSEKYLPENNSAAARILKLFMKGYPKARHVLFCDTAFFVGLPEAASTYAVPYEFTKQGVKKYGGGGLCHNWVSRAIERLKRNENPEKIVSIFVAEATNVAAIRSGKPVETSAGFTQVEGIPSMTACGDIDPMIIFQLHAAGLKYGDINRILTRESGFDGLAGRKLRLEDIVGGEKTPGLDGIKDIYYYNVIKHVGYSAAAMGGADAIAVTASSRAIACNFAKELSKRIEFPSLKLKDTKTAGEDLVEVTARGSQAEVYVGVYDRWKTMDGLTGQE